MNFVSAGGSFKAQRLSEGVRNSYRETEMTFVACLENLKVKEATRCE